MMPWIRRLLAVAVAAAFVAPAAALPQGATGGTSVSHATLANGMQIYVLQNRLSPVVALYTNYLAGSNEESITGLAHAQEHMMFRGSKTLDASQFSETTAITGGEYNADTQNEITQYFFEMPSQYLDIALNLERSRATGVLDAQQDWDQERGAITQEVTRDNSGAVFRLETKAIAHVFAGTPDADYGLGTVDSFKQIQAPLLKQFYARWYHPNNVIMVIAGNVDPQATIAKVRALFGSIPAAKLPARATGTLKPLTPLTLHDYSSDPDTVVFLAYRSPGYDDADYYAGEILNDVLSSSRGALYDLQANGKALVTFAEPIEHPRAGMTLVGSAVPVSTSPDTAVADLKAVIEKYKQTGFPSDLVEAAKAHELTQAELQENSINGLAQEWSQDLAIEHRTPDDELAGMQKVTVDDVNRVFRKYFDNATATVAVATPKEAAGSAFVAREGEDNAVPPTKQVALPAFARSVLAQLRVPESTIVPVVQTLPNGLKLIVVPSTISPTVSVRGQVLSNPGLEAPPGREGVDSIVDGLFTYGTTTYDRLAYQAQLDAIAANETAGDSFSLDVQSKNFDRGVDLLADNELHPTFPAEAFAIVKQQSIGDLTGAVQGPDYKAQVATAAALYPKDDPERRIASPQSVATITLDDAKAYYAHVYRPDRTTIVVIGDVTVAQARAAIDRAFGSWSASGATPDVYDPAVPRNAAAQIAIPATGRVQSNVTLSETLPLSYNDPDYALLKLGNVALSGGFGSLFYRDVRQVKGYAYFVDSSLTGGRYRSTFSINYGSDPANTAKAESLIRSDLTSVCKQPLDADMLLRAKAQVLGILPVLQESYDGIASQYLIYEQRGQPLDQDRIGARRQLAATGNQVRDAFAKWIRPDGFVRVVLAPAR